MHAILLAALAYLVAAMIVAGLAHGDLALVLRSTIVQANDASGLMLWMGGRIWPFVILALLLIGYKRILARLVPFCELIVVLAVLPIAFAMAKNAIPVLVPYYADAWLAKVDRMVHFGTDPWRIAHAITGSVAPWMIAVYTNYWVTFAAAFPAIVLLTDRNDARLRRYAWLFLLSWIVIGNFMALAGSSVGPVFYDRLLGGDRFAGLGAALAQSGLTQTPIGWMQDWLWQRYNEDPVTRGLGISAFPSMHVAIASMVAMYLYERSVFLGALGAAFLAVVFFLSVYTGYHYALDGYASILAVLGLNMTLKRYLTAQPHEMMQHRTAAS
ncbi:MAG TPA: phosphatase PAP2 family protein [Paenirhodobacter sp.]